MDTPVIETGRLILCAHRLSDFTLLAEMWADPDVVRFIGGKPFTREESWVRLLRLLGHWKLLGFGYWAVELKESGRFIGVDNAASIRIAQKNGYREFIRTDFKGAAVIQFRR